MVVKDAAEKGKSIKLESLFSKTSEGFL